mmetsp:Transcript_155/g.513  ORF Transcript_155/g.513 Transcript_155/m.513 type:complete len:226 (+) Transcript_155:501-1178(+)
MPAASSSPPPPSNGIGERERARSAATAVDHGCGLCARSSARLGVRSGADELARRGGERTASLRAGESRLLGGVRALTRSFWCSRLAWITSKGVERSDSGAGSIARSSCRSAPTTRERMRGGEPACASGATDGRASGGIGLSTPVLGPRFGPRATASTSSRILARTLGLSSAADVCSAGWSTHSCTSVSSASSRRPVRTSGSASRSRGKPTHRKPSTASSSSLGSA